MYFSNNSSQIPNRDNHYTERLDILLSGYFITEQFKSAYANLMCRLDWSSHDSMDNKCQRE